MIQETKDVIGQGVILVAPDIINELWKQTLLLPDTYKVTAVTLRDEGAPFGKCLEIHVESTEIPVVADGEQKPIVTPRYTVHQHEDTNTGKLHRFHTLERIEIVGKQ